MRFSPYPMEDYGLQHGGGVVSPFGEAPGREPEWNLYWASIPELEKYLEIGYEDFDSFKLLSRTFPHLRQVKLQGLLKADQGMANHLEFDTPAQTAKYIQVNERLHHRYLGDGYAGWRETVESRLAMAQSLVDVKEASALCQSVVAVDFRARRRM